MNRKLVLFTMMFFTMPLIWPQTNKNSRIPLIGEDAPSFTARSTSGTINFPADFGLKWKILFSHPADFTPVCTSEILELAHMQSDFKNLNVEIAVVSTDDLALHQSWLESMNGLKYKGVEPVKIDFPLIDDSKFDISLKYGMLSPFVDSRKTVRGVFIIDPHNKIQAIFFYPKNVGRNLEEVKRTVIALQTAGENSVLTPVNWKPGEDVLLPYPYPYTYYDPSQAEDAGCYSISWYMLYKKLDQ